jgi:hypothetical protein
MGRVLFYNTPVTPKVYIGAQIVIEVGTDVKWLLFDRRLRV